MTAISQHMLHMLTAALTLLLGAEAVVHANGHTRAHAHSLDAAYRTDHQASFAALRSKQPTSTATLQHTEVDPTAQPNSRGQDEGGCGVVELPSDLYLTPKVSDGVTKSGVWETADGATYVNWKQDLFAWQYEAVYFYVDDKLFIKSEPIENEKVQLPSYFKNADKDEDKFHTFALRDCDDVILYIIRETKGKHNVYEIFNRADERVAWSEMGSLYVDQMHFYDDDNKPIAIAQSPKIMGDTHRIIDDRADPYFGGIPTWEIQFLMGYNSKSELVRTDPAKEGCQRCWVIAAAVQERAIRNSMRADNGRIKEPEAFPWFVGLFILALAVIVGAIAYFFFWVFRLVYPKSYDEMQNKFLLSNKSIYGDLQARLDQPQPGRAPAPAPYGAYQR